MSSSPLAMVDRPPLPLSPASGDFKSLRLIRYNTAPQRHNTTTPQHHQHSLSGREAEACDAVGGGTNPLLDRCLVSIILVSDDEPLHHINTSAHQVIINCKRTSNRSIGHTLSLSPTLSLNPLRSEQPTDLILEPVEGTEEQRRERSIPVQPKQHAMRLADVRVVEAVR